jgi:hypothetical protein
MCKDKKRFKIGFAKDPKKRFKSFDYVEYDLQKSFLLKCKNNNSARRIENILHKVCFEQKDYMFYTKKYDGGTEWFNINAIENVKKQITLLIKMKNSDIIGKLKRFNLEEEFFESKKSKLLPQQVSIEHLICFQKNNVLFSKMQVLVNEIDNIIKKNKLSDKENRSPSFDILQSDKLSMEERKKIEIYNNFKKLIIEKLQKIRRDFNLIGESVFNSRTIGYTKTFFYDLKAFFGNKPIEDCLVLYFKNFNLYSKVIGLRENNSLKETTINRRRNTYDRLMCDLNYFLNQYKLA